MASSALYRYYPSRDELLTALIVEAYDALGERAEAADAAATHDGLVARWAAVCHAVRDWAREHPHQYALVYGSPVPGYRAPERTVEPASRVILVLTGIVRDAHRAGALTGPPGPPLPASWDDDATRVADLVMPGVPSDTVARALMAWTQLFGLISFELFGHLVGSVEDTDLLFEVVLAQMAAFVGLGTQPAS
jgi:AcrR family transcriptional regulator